MARGCATHPRNDMRTSTRIAATFSIMCVLIGAGFSAYPVKAAVLYNQTSGSVDGWGAGYTTQGPAFEVIDCNKVNGNVTTAVFYGAANSGNNSTSTITVASSTATLKLCDYAVCGYAYATTTFDTPWACPAGSFQKMQFQYATGQTPYLKIDDTNPDTTSFWISRDNDYVGTAQTGGYKYDLRMKLEGTAITSSGSGTTTSTTTTTQLFTTEQNEILFTALTLMLWGMIFGFFYWISTRFV